MNTYRIWSVEHNAWWKAGRNGYAKEFYLAGIFSEEEAFKIVAGANFNMKPPNEALVPVEPDYNMENQSR